jgi:Prealbumin-like fold domain
VWERFAVRKFLVLAGLSLAFITNKVKAENPALSTGLEGVISVSPIHGGPVRAGQPSSAPLANTTFEITDAAGSVKTFTTDASGQFRVSLPPGTYSVKLAVPKKFPRCGPFQAKVTGSGFLAVQWECDSGMR